MRVIIVATIISLLIIGIVEYAYRETGGLPSVIPGKTSLELQWRIQQADDDPAIYFIGDSRVDWGIADRSITQLFETQYDTQVQAVNAGLSAGSVTQITQFILDHHPQPTPGLLVLNYSPTGFYHFKT
ncbi:hypothetical protein GF339_23395, partial [candidate division KSB3 bacterium]|nr:hypothetical protein [candidate division KSB3 bacterium]MBD3327549.1 hypothetical protein [candidate division KSB3 bacterium]